MRSFRNPITCILTVSLTSMLLLSGCGSSASSALIPALKTPDFDHDYPVGEITDMALVGQSLTCPFSEPQVLVLYGATYMRSNTGTVSISFSKDGDDSNTPLFLWEIDCAQMSDNTPLLLYFDPSYASDTALTDTLSGMSGLGSDSVSEALTVLPTTFSSKTALKKQACRIEISSPDCFAGNAVTFWTTPEDCYEDGALSIGGYEQYNDLWFQLIGK